MWGDLDRHFTRAGWRRREVRLVVLAVLLAMWVVALWGVRAAVGHEAASGWTYPLSCCSGHDCYEISADEIEASPVGWIVRATGELVPYETAKVSGDGRLHRCSYGGDRKAGTICLFIPAGA